MTFCLLSITVYIINKRVCLILRILRKIGFNEWDKLSYLFCFYFTFCYVMGIIYLFIFGIMLSWKLFIYIRNSAMSWDFLNVFL